MRMLQHISMFGSGRDGRVQAGLFEIYIPDLNISIVVSLLSTIA